MVSWLCNLEVTDDLVSRLEALADRHVGYGCLPLHCKYLSVSPWCPLADDPRFFVLTPQTDLRGRASISCTYATPPPPPLLTYLGTLMTPESWCKSSCSPPPPVTVSSSAAVVACRECSPASRKRWPKVVAVSCATTAGEAIFRYPNGDVLICCTDGANNVCLFLPSVFRQTKLEATPSNTPCVLRPRTKTQNKWRSL